MHVKRINSRFVILILMMHSLVILLGGNIGDRLSILNHAISKISAQLGEVVKQSSFYESEPWGYNDSFQYLNAVVEVQTNLAPQECLDLLLNIEKDLGRKRIEKGVYEARTIDLDILFYDNIVLKTDFLTIPHPLLQERLFTLQPLNEILPHLMHPVFNKSIKQLLNLCNDSSNVHRIDDLS